MAEGATSLKGLRTQIVADAQAQAEERRSLAGNGPRPPAPLANPSPSTAKSPRPVIDGAALRIDDRLRVAKERREEADRQHATKESQILERERRTQLQVERQMEERQKKLEEQRRKEEQRRSAVEEKRRNKQEEEKEHYEAVMRRTLERSQRLEQRQKRWSWGGLSESDSRPGDLDTGASSPVAIVISPASPEKRPRTQQVDKRSTSSVNLKQPVDSGINKRLSSSSATLLNSPDKSARVRSSSLNRLPRNNSAIVDSKEGRKTLQVDQTGPSLKKRSSSLTRVGGGRVATPSKIVNGTSNDTARKPLVSTVDGGFLSRLLTPTQASLARSKSAAALSAEGTEAQASSILLQPGQRGPLRSRSIDRQKSPTMHTSASADQLDPSSKEKRFMSPAGKRPASPSNMTGRHRSPSPAPLSASRRPPSPSALKQSPRNRPPSPGGIKQRPPSPQPGSVKSPSPQPTSAKPPPIQRPALTPTGPPTLRKRDSKAKDLCPVQPLVPPSPETHQNSPVSVLTQPPSSKTKDKEDKSMAGTNSAAEAAMILAENRRVAREKKEREEALRVQREEEERLRKEEEKRLAEEARLKRLEEEKRLAEERRKKEEDDARMAEADRERLEAEEAVRQAELQREREEADARAVIEAENVRLEREKVLARNQQERMERKKRIEEIMKRTRKADLEKREGNEKGLQDEEDEDEEEMDDQGDDQGDDHQIICEGETEGGATDAEIDQGCGLTSREPMGKREEPLGSVNGKLEADKENNNGTRSEEQLAVRPVSKGCLLEGSDFLNGTPGPWSFEELLDLGVNAKGRPGVLGCDGVPEVPGVSMEDKVNHIHPSSQPIEALSEM
ncbi:hypothetical protein DPEC_G00029010 [Dallia pectoralis]|uniref:Uncharacterized protein n=1 Tax=Dallia pectoralis TaxID=75939 RepID=A0ACC2HI77_DALPE|nr:hypothetical protein DPEC_G00029010 [Dallia pectoralis]